MKFERFSELIHVCESEVAPNSNVWKAYYRQKKNIYTDIARKITLVLEALLSLHKLISSMLGVQCGGLAYENF